jgi:hypothetical protein
MSAAVHISIEAFSEGVFLPVQYNDLARPGPSVMTGEYRLLWAVLEDAIHSYLANRNPSTRNQQREFEEVWRWLHLRRQQPRDLFTFENLCEVFDLDADLLLKALETLPHGDWLLRYRAVAGPRKLQRLAA